MMIQVILASIAVLQILVGGVGILGATATAAAGRRGGATVAATRRLVTLTGGIRDTAIHAGRGIAIRITIPILPGLRLIHLGLQIHIHVHVHLLGHYDQGSTLPQRIILGIHILFERLIRLGGVHDDLHLRRRVIHTGHHRGHGCSSSYASSSWNCCFVRHPAAKSLQFRDTGNSK